ncbi:Uncharacterized protein PECH_002700 [Penicillium ucsense]|uniref:Tail specific protease domain-containing protein n=1 Tax=Penicillium ucsense TaxID=2839758 RepID=A0A8J8W4B2_9EURO|nr:Uncharacterized protein PECM_003583 [Penicillium ucsense]KAF7737867.1 Uncharacterized protein PECH_002700 [Penicillium ucsense]
MRLQAFLSIPVAWAAATDVSENAVDSEPCEQISKLVADANASQSVARIPHDLTRQCLMSMPFESARAVSFLDEAKKYLQFQSTVDILKFPPSGYPLPSTDLLEGISVISKKVKSNGYSSQFQTDLDVSNLIKSAHDGHLVFQLCSQSIFDLAIDLPLVSISSNGLKLPEIYTLDDAKLLQNGSDNVSALTLINGTEAANFLSTYAAGQSLQDKDAQYNRNFPAVARNFANTPTDPNGIWFRTTDWSEGSLMTLTFANGTTRRIKKRAIPKERLFAYKNGTSLYNSHCIPRGLPKAKTAIATETEEASSVPGLPNTQWRNSANTIAGFYSNMTGLEDTAIMFLPSFASSPGEAAQIAVNFLQNATTAGKTSIVIDVSANPGGYLSYGIDLARIFFPDAEPYTATRYRAHTAAKYLTEAFAASDTPDSSKAFAYREMVKPDQKSGFSSWQDLYGPEVILGSPSSNLLANFNYSATSTATYPINGYGSVPLIPKQPPFPAKNITIVTDGDCASTCAIFVKFMKRQGVRTIAFGGRPNESHMQGVGGVKGGQSLGINNINGYIQQASQLILDSMNTSSPILTLEEWREFNESSPGQITSFAWSGNVNLRNEYDPDDDQVPLQFKYEAAECRRFYTLENYLGRETVWRDAAQSMFGDGGCVKGSTGGKGSLGPVTGS